MPSSTSSSEVLRDVPALPWSRALVVAMVVFVTAFGAWEAYWRAEWFVPSYRNSDGLWAITRDRIDREQGGVVIVSSSRLLFDVNLDAWRDETGILPIQLGLEGTNPRPFLAHVANETSFNGLVVVGVTEGLFFSAGTGLRAEVLQRYRDRSLADRASQWLSMHLVEPYVASYDPDIALFTIVRRQAAWPDRRDMVRPRPQVRKLALTRRTRQTDMWNKVELDEAYRESARAVWRASLTAPRPAPPPPDVARKALDDLFAEVAANVRAIRARGGEVVFVRAPSTGLYWQIEPVAFPRERFWNPLVTTADAAGVHFADHADLQVFELPEWSHIRAGDTDPFTRALLRHLRAALEARGTPRSEVGR